MFVSVISSKASLLYFFLNNLRCCIIFICSVFRFDTGHGIIIEGIFPKDFTCEVVPWTSDERLNIINNNVFPDGFTLETDLYFVKNSKTGDPLDGNTIPAENMLLKAILPKEKTYANKYFKYKGAVRFDNTWKLLESQVC